MSGKRSGGRRNFAQVWRRDGGICQYCGALAECVDHVIPWSYRPDNSMANLVASCTPCNLVALDFVFQSFSEKQAYILKRRGIGLVVPPRQVATPATGVPPAKPPVAAAPDGPETLADARRDDARRERARLYPSRQRAKMRARSGSVGSCLARDEFDS